MEVDTKGERTIAVLTKFDQFEGSPKYLSQIFGRKLINLNLGFVVASNLEVENPRFYEQLFGRFPVLEEYNNYGRQNLIEKLSSLLVLKIQKQVPLLRQDLHSLLNSLEA